MVFAFSAGMEVSKETVTVHELECCELEKLCDTILKMTILLPVTEYVAVPGRNRTLIRTIFQPRFRVQSAVAQYFR